MIRMTLRARRLSARSSREGASVTFRAVLVWLAIARGVEIAAEIDRVRGYSAGRFVPVIHVAFRAGRLPDGTSLEAVAVARGATQERLAVAARVKRRAEHHVMRRPGRRARPSLPRSHRIIRVPAARRREGDEDGRGDREKRFSFHNRLQCGCHASLIQGLRVQVKSDRGARGVAQVFAAGDGIGNFTRPWISAVFIAYQCKCSQPITRTRQRFLI